MSWLPLAWAGYILVLQFDIWWELYGLVTLERWTIGAFVQILLIALLLFAAGGLVLRRRGVTTRRISRSISSKTDDGP